MEQKKLTAEETLVVQGAQLQAVIRQRDEANNKLAGMEANLSLANQQMRQMDQLLKAWKDSDEAAFNEAVKALQQSQPDPQPQGVPA